jgi:large subunit ribosomal protein L23
MSNVSDTSKPKVDKDNVISSWVDHVLFDEIKQLSTTKKALWSLEYRRYTFLVSPSLTKSLIKLAVEQYFNVKVIKVNTCNLLPKTKRMGETSGKTARLKKAIVTLDPKDEIPLFSDI